MRNTIKAMISRIWWPGNGSNEKEKAEILRCFDVEQYAFNPVLKNGIVSLQKDLNAALQQWKSWKNPYNDLVVLLNGAYEGDWDAVDMIIETETPKIESKKLLAMYNNTQIDAYSELSSLLQQLNVPDSVQPDLNNFRDLFESIHSSGAFSPEQKTTIVGFVYAYIIPRMGGRKGAEGAEDRSTFISKFVDHIVRPWYFGDSENNRKAILDLVKCMLRFQINFIEFNPHVKPLLSKIQDAQSLDEIVWVLQQDKQNNIIRL